ncbi:sensor histidine kinase [Streptomyces sp. NPDC004286]|uniref:sensor histidine kinase n=1 Tax=Streptomyces sp. NPDC004286 TaxID=3364696 RepID=UPI0036A24121
MTVVTRTAHPVTVAVGESGGTGSLVVLSSRLGQRLRRADRAHPWVLNAAVVALVVSVFCVPDLLHGIDDGDKAGRFRLTPARLPVIEILALQAGLVLPLLWRRRRPALAFGVIAAAFFLQWFLGTALRADIALFVALYGVALRSRTPQLLWSCGITAGALVPAAVRVSGVLSVWVSLFFLLSTATAAVALGLTVRIRRAQLAGLRDRATRLETERDQRSRLAAAAERARVARGMHDVVGHNLAVIVTLADAGLRVTASGQRPGPEVLRSITDAGRQALGELKRVLGVLGEHAQDEGPGLMPQPRLADIGALCEGVRAVGLNVVHRTVGNVDDLDGKVQLTAYRIAQEALINSLKHAGPGARVKLVVVVSGSRLVITVRDGGPPDGDSESRGHARQEGYGLAGMREHAARCGGRLHAGPARRGWAVEAVLQIP